MDYSSSGIRGGQRSYAVFVMNISIVLLLGCCGYDTGVLRGGGLVLWASGWVALRSYLRMSFMSVMN